MLMSALLALAPAAALARPWNGINPGVTDQAEVLKKFGEPTRRIKRGGLTVLTYSDAEKLEGTRQAQFHVDAAGLVTEVTIFLAEPLDPESVEGMYGKPGQKTFVETTFQKVWIYPPQGVAVYWAKDGSGAEALSFTPGRTDKGGKVEPTPARTGGGGKAGAGSKATETP
jgi:hypothetical protein